MFHYSFLTRLILIVKCFSCLRDMKHTRKFHDILKRSKKLRHRFFLTRNFLSFSSSFSFFFRPESSCTFTVIVSLHTSLLKTCLGHLSYRPKYTTFLPCQLLPFPTYFSSTENAFCSCAHISKQELLRTIMFHFSSIVLLLYNLTFYLQKRFFIKMQNIKIYIKNCLLFSLR